MASLIRYDWTANPMPGRILFANPDVLEHEFSPGNVEIDRKRLTVKLSQDDGTTWPVSRILEEGPSGYSDLAVLSDGKVLCLYECGMLDHMYDPKHLTLACFDLEWLSK